VTSLSEIGPRGPQIGGLSFEDVYFPEKKVTMLTVASVAANRLLAPNTRFVKFHP
jgi:hypothetical protein